MRCVLLLIIFIFKFLVLQAQTNDNIWLLLGSYLKSQGELGNDETIMPYKTDDGGTVFTFMIFTNDDSISNPNYEFDKSDKLTLYRFGRLGVYSPTHLFVTYNGKYDIINMNHTLCDIMISGIKLCKKLCIDDRLEIDVFRELLSLYITNYEMSENASTVIKVE